MVHPDTVLVLILTRDYDTQSIYGLNVFKIILGCGSYDLLLRPFNFQLGMILVTRASQKSNM